VSKIRIDKKLEVLNQLNDNYIPVGSIDKSINDLKYLPIYRLLEKWKREGFVESQEVVNKKPGGLKVLYRLSKKGINLKNLLSPKQVKIKKRPASMDKTELFDRFTNSIKSVISSELEGELEDYISKEVIKKIQSNILNEIHDKLFEFSN